MSLRERKKQQSRLDILRAARQLIEAQGYENTKMRDVAAAANISYQTLYNYFPSKALILSALLTEQVEQVANRIEDLLQAYEGGLLASLAEINRIRMEVIANEDRELWRIVFLELWQTESPVDQVYQLVDEAAHELLLKLLAQAQTLGELTTEIDTTLLADTLFSLAQHSIGRLMTQPEIDHHQALAQLTAQVTLLVSPYLVLSPVTFSSSGGSRIVSPQESDKHP